MAVNRGMDFSDLPRRPRPAQAPALAGYQGGGYANYDEYTPYGEMRPEFGDASRYAGVAGLTDTMPQRAPWDEPRVSTRDTPTATDAFYVGDDRFAGGDAFAGGDGYTTSGGYAASDGYTTSGGYAGGDGYTTSDGYAASDGYTTSGGYAASDGYAHSGGYAGGGYAHSDGFAANDRDDVQPRDDIQPMGWQASPRPGGLGLLAGAVTGLIGVAVALGVANLAAAFLRPQASPITTVGGVFIMRTPPVLRNFAMAKFGQHDMTLLLVGMYATVALVAIVIGMCAWRRVWVGVWGIALFGLIAAFVTITQPKSHLSDMIPSIIGGIAAIAAIAGLINVGTQMTGPESPDQEPADPYISSPSRAGWSA
jgi:hypothetical protein